VLFSFFALLAFGFNILATLVLCSFLVPANANDLTTLPRVIGAMVAGLFVLPFLMAMLALFTSYGRTLYGQLCIFIWSNLATGIYHVARVILLVAAGKLPNPNQPAPAVSNVRIRTMQQAAAHVTTAITDPVFPQARTTRAGGFP
jgi:hypothetical protein